MADIALDELTERESELLMHVESRSGSMEAKDAELLHDGTAAAYRDLQFEYLSLAEAGSLEALKRALFIGWYSREEPTCFTGLASIEDEQFLRAQELGLVTLESAGVDDEFLAMLGWYAVVSIHLFGGSRPADRFVHRLKKLARHAKLIAGSSPSQFAGRGAMGSYFASVPHGPA